MKVLLIWEEIPEQVRIYLLDGEIADQARKAHGQLINSTEDTAEAEILSEMLEGIEALNLASPVKIEEPVEIVMSGFIL